LFANEASISFPNKRSHRASNQTVNQRARAEEPN
jgi:hypothetical protein